MSIEEIKKLIAKPEDIVFEGQTVLPPSKTLAAIIASFANTKGGHIVLGIKKNPDFSRSIVGLSQDFRAKEIAQRALELLFPQPIVEQNYCVIDGKQVFVIAVEKSLIDVLLDKQKYVRLENGQVTVQNAVVHTSKDSSLNSIYLLLNEESKTTGSFRSFKQHYLNIANILNDMLQNNKSKDEMSILKRILFSSCADNFEKYLSDLLFEIFLANPNSMKSEEIVTVEEVLKCADIQEFIMYYAGKKIQKLQKGNVKAFLKDTKPLADLKVISDADMIEINKILDIRHLFTHKNGIVDQKFANVFSNVCVGDSFELTVKEMCEKTCTLINMAKKLDKKAIEKYELSVL